MTTTLTAVYTRLSKDDAGALSATHRQEVACRRFAALRGWEVGAVFTDVDASAYQPRARRPGYEALLRAVAAGEVRAVLVWKLDRLVRRPAEFERFWAACEASGVALASVTEPIDTANELGLALVRVLVTFASLESTATSVRLKARAREMAEAGHRPTGAKAFGLTADWGAVVPEEATLVQEAAARVLSSEGLRSIVRDWNARGVPPLRAASWGPNTLRRLLLARRMAGDREYRGEVVATGCFPAVLDRLTAARVRAALADPTRRRGAPASGAYLLTGLLRCGRCGGRVRGAPRTAGRYYRCPPEPTACNGVSVKADPAEAWVVAAAFERAEQRRRVAPRPVATPPTAVAEAAAVVEDRAAALRQLSLDYYARRVITRDEFFAARSALEHAVRAATRAAVPEVREAAVPVAAGGLCEPRGRHSARRSAAGPWRPSWTTSSSAPPGTVGASTRPASSSCGGSGDGRRDALAPSGGEPPRLAVARRLAGRALTKGRRRPRVARTAPEGPSTGRRAEPSRCSRHTDLSGSLRSWRRVRAASGALRAGRHEPVDPSRFVRRGAQLRSLPAPPFEAGSCKRPSRRPDRAGPRRRRGGSTGRGAPVRWHGRGTVLLAVPQTPRPVR